LQATSPTHKHLGLGESSSRPVTAPVWGGAWGNAAAMAACEG